MDRYFLRGATDNVGAPRASVLGVTGAAGAGAFFGFFCSLLPR
jgi:hypothetical protein